MIVRLRKRFQPAATALFSAPAEKKIGHLYAIDFARGLAALSILIWHYQHFFFPSAEAPHTTVPRDIQPWYHQLSVFYEEGAHAVEFFWLISGFVFAAVYVAGKKSTTREFVSHRFARLYPLHFLTLLTVAILQIISLRLVGHEQIYGHNDLWQFILNIFLATNWGNQQVDSFNAPIWSVSVEVLIYALFWISLAKLYRFGIAGPAIFALAGWLVHFHFMGTSQDFIFLCVFYYFLGTTLFLLIDAIARKPLMLLVASVALLGIGSAIYVHATRSLSIGLPCLLVGILLLFCAIEAAERGHHFRALSWIGDNTYGTYLLHVPIQIGTLTILDRFAISRSIALSPLFFVGFIVLVVALARLSFLYFERPARENLRQVLR